MINLNIFEFMLKYSLLENWVRVKCVFLLRHGVFLFVFCQ